MIDTPEKCLASAAASRLAAEGTMLENIRTKHLKSAIAWENLAQIISGEARANHALRLVNQIN